jgi:hypothetical protein
MSEWYELLGSYIRRQIAEGKFCDVDPVLAARGFIGMVFHHYLVQELFGGARYRSYDIEEVAQTMATLWLNGISCTPDQGRLQSSSVPNTISRRAPICSLPQAKEV